MTRALAVIDGEHYAPVVRAALEELPYEFVAAHVVGGTEKLRGDADYGVAVAADLDRALAEHRPELVVDLSDEPVLGPQERFRLASRVLAAGLPYVGADFRFDPPAARAVPAPVDRDRRHRQAGRQDRRHGARRAALRARPEGRRRRDGPRRPARARGGDRAPDVDALLELSRSGRHAASDYLETAALAGVRDGRLPPLRRRARRRGLDLERAPRAPGSRVELEPGPRPLRRQRRRDPAGRDRPPRPRRQRAAGSGRRHRLPERLPAPRLRSRRPDDGRGGLGLGGAARPRPRARRRAWSRRCCGRSRSSPSPAGRSRSSRPRPSRRTSSCAPTSRDEHGADVVHVSGSLADRAALRDELERVEAEVFLVELKAAAIDVVAEAARERGVEVVLAGSDVSPSPASRPRRRAAAPRGGGGRRERAAEGRASLPRRARTAAVLEGPDGACADRGRRRRRTSAYELARRTEADLARAAARSRSTSTGCAELAVDLLGEERGAARGAPAAPLPRPPGARPARDPARRRRHRHRQVDGRDRGRLPARDHPRDLDRLRPPDDARVLRARSSCRRSTTRASRRGSG